MARQPKFYFNTKTGEVEEGRWQFWGSRMGPYRTRADAERALDRAARRTDAWDEEERRERAERDGEQ